MLDIMELYTNYLRSLSKDKLLIFGSGLLKNALRQWYWLRASIGTLL